MKYTISLLSAVIMLLFVSSAYKQTSIPNPEDFAQKVLEYVKKNNKQEYLNAFSIQDAEIQWAINSITSDPFVSAEDKIRWEERLRDTMKTNEMNRDLSEGYDELMIWMQTENINPAELEYVRMYFELEKVRQGSVYVLDDTELFVKYKDKYYCIRFDEAVFLNNKWVLGEIKYISVRDQYLERENYDYYGSADSTAVAYDTTMAAPVDTAAIGPAYYEDYVEPTLTKKQQKIQKKIIKLEQKTYELYDEMGVY